jgi:hypothetical protein
MTNERYIIEMTCIDEGNDWGLTYGQKVYWTQVGAFATSPFDASFYKTKTMLMPFIDTILNEGNFMPQIKTLTFIIS